MEQMSLRIHIGRLPANVCFVELEGIGLDVSWKWDDIARNLH